MWGQTRQACWGWCCPCCSCHCPSFPASRCAIHWGPLLRLKGGHHKAVLPFDVIVVTIRVLIDTNFVLALGIFGGWKKLKFAVCLIFSVWVARQVAWLVPDRKPQWGPFGGKSLLRKLWCFLGWEGWSSSLLRSVNSQLGIFFREILDFF